MKALKVWLVVSLFCASASAFADEAAKKQAELLLDSMGMEDLMKQSMSQMIDVQMRQNPAMLPYKDVMMKFLSKHMSWESLKPEVVKVYADTFSAAELRKINDFYSTPVGKKSIKEMPKLMAKGSELGASRVQANIGELQAMIQAETERLKKKNGK